MKNRQLHLAFCVIYRRIMIRLSNLELSLRKCRERKVLCIYRQPSSLNTICNKCGYTNQTRKHTRNITVPVVFVSVVYSNYRGRTTHLFRNKERKARFYKYGTDWVIAVHNYLTQYVIMVYIRL